jgi:hypothetical protein
MPTCDHAAFSASTSCACSGTPLENCMESLSGVPLGMPAPQSVAPLPGRTHVDVPFGATFQPWSFSRAVAPATLYGYGLTVSVFDAQVPGLVGTGP